MSKITFYVTCHTSDSKISSEEYIGIVTGWGDTPDEAIEALKREGVKVLGGIAEREHALRDAAVGATFWVRTAMTCNTRIAFGEHPRFGMGWCAYGTLKTLALIPQSGAVPNDAVETRGGPARIQPGWPIT
jgi:hypothetical protein